MTPFASAPLGLRWASASGLLLPWSSSVECASPTWMLRGCYGISAREVPCGRALARASPSVASWTVGVEDQSVARLWQRRRQAAALCTHLGAERADHYLACITARINEQTAARLDYAE